MKYRKLGHTSLDVSMLALGGSSLGGAFHEVEETADIRTVHIAIDNGVNLIDTAPFYGLTKAETVLGKALRKIPREKYLLATKVARYGYQQEDFDFSAGRVTKSVDESLKRLGVDYVDFFQVHDMEFGRIEQIINETVPALRKVQAAGKARFVGIACLPVKFFRQVTDQVEVDQIQSYCHYCLNATALVDLLPELKAKGVAIFNSAPLAMRLLSDGVPPDWHPASSYAPSARWPRYSAASVAPPSASSLCNSPSQIPILRFLRFCGLGCNEHYDSHEQQQDRSALRPGV